MKRFYFMLPALCILAGVLAMAGSVSPTTAASPVKHAWIDPWRHLSGVVVVPPATMMRRTSGEAGQLWGPLNPPVFGPNVDATLNNPANQNETTISIYPANDQRVIAAANDYRANLQPWVYLSTNGGTNWTNYQVPGTTSLLYGDPAMSFGPDNNKAYFSYLGYTAICNPNGGMYVSRSDDAGSTFSPPILLAANTNDGQICTFQDKEYVAVDKHPTSPNYGKTYIGWTHYVFNAARISEGSGAQIEAPAVLSRSTDQGITWSVPITVSPPYSNNNAGIVPATGNNGEVYLYYLGAATQSQTNVDSILFSRSTDGGQTFPFFTHISNVTDIPSPLPGTQFRDNAYGSIAVDRTMDGYLYTVWSDYRNGDADILLSRSTDNGTTWSAPTRLNDDAVGNGKDQYFPWIASSEDGLVHASWHDEREGSGAQYKEYYTYSSDHGETWAANIAVSTAPSNPGSSTFIGDYSGIDAVPGVVMPVWTDIRAGTNQNAYTARGVKSGQATPTSTPVGTITPLPLCTVATSTPYPTATAYPTQPPYSCSTPSTNTPYPTSTPYPCPSCPTNTPAPTSTYTHTPTQTPTPTATNTPTPTDTPTPTPTFSGQCTLQTATPNPTYTPRPTSTPRPTVTPCFFFTYTPRPTYTPNPTYTPTYASQSTPTSTSTIVACCGRLTGGVLTECLIDPTPSTSTFQATIEINNPCPFSVPATEQSILDVSTNGTTWQTWTQTTARSINIAPGPPPYTVNEFFSNQSIPAQYNYYRITAHITEASDCQTYFFTSPASPICRGDTTPTVTAQATAATTGTSTAVTATATACTITFTDVPPDNPFYPFIRCLACREIISGYGDGTFRPGNEITRGQIAKIVSNAAGFEEDPGPQVYEDVDSTNPFYQWINRLSNRGFMGGYPCGIIDPEPCVPPANLPYFRTFANATRGQLAKIVSNAAGIGGTPTGLFYTDVPEDNPFYLWVMRLTDLGVMSGYPCGGEGEPCDDQQRPYFRPFANVTRGQASKIVANTFFPDCQTPVR